MDSIPWNSSNNIPKMLHVGNFYLQRSKMATFKREMQVNIPYREHLGTLDNPICDRQWIICSSFRLPQKDDLIGKNVHSKNHQQLPGWSHITKSRSFQEQLQDQGLHSVRPPKKTWLHSRFMNYCDLCKPRLTGQGLHFFPYDLRFFPQSH